MNHPEGKVAIITGAGSGIGSATARLLAERGVKVVLASRRIERLEEMVAVINAAGGEAACIATDVTKRNDMQALVDFALKHFGFLDVLISNAGIAPNSLLDELRVEDWEAMIDVNIKGVLYGIAAALPVFRAQGSGHFVNVLSTAGLIIKPTMAVYAGTKNAVRTITEALRQEAGPNLRVTGISPGFVRTDLAMSMPDEVVRGKTIEMMEAIALSPDAIARAIAFAIDQPADVDVGEITVRPTAQAG